MNEIRRTTQLTECCVHIRLGDVFVADLEVGIHLQSVGTVGGEIVDFY